MTDTKRHMSRLPIIRHIRWWMVERKEAADRIEELEAQVRAADALADAFEDFNGKIDKARAPVGPARIAAIEALAAYQAAKEGE